MHSLAARHPWRLDIPLLLSFSIVLLAQGLTTPALEIRALFIFRDQHTVVSNIQKLHSDGRTTAALVLAGCSIVYPAVKIAVLLFLWLTPFPARWRRRLVRLIRLMGRWSMLDVFAITALVVGSRTILLLEARPLPGIYIYAAAVFVLMIVTVMMDRLARNGR
jgi:paraquat-inducible protein A